MTSVTAPTTEVDAPLSDEVLSRAFEMFPNGPDGAPADPEEPDPVAPETTEADPPPKAEGDTPDSTTPTDTTAAADQPPAPDVWAELTKEAKPLSYKQSGEAKVFDGILEVPGKGAIIPADKLEDVRNLVARYESNAATTKDLHAKMQHVERAYGGVSGIQEKMELSAQINAAAMQILNALTTDPTQFVAVVDGQIVPNAPAIASVRREAMLAAREAVWEERQEREKQEQTWQAETGDTDVRQHAVPNAIDQLAPRFHLSPDDVQAAKTYFGPFADALTYKATPEDAQKYGYPVGTWLVNVEKMRPWLEGRQTEKKQQQEAEKAKLAAVRENATRAPAKPAPKAAPKAKVAPRNEDGTFKERKRYSASEHIERALAGKAPPGMADDE